MWSYLFLIISFSCFLYFETLIMKGPLFISGCTLLSSSLFYLLLIEPFLIFLHGISFSVYFQKSESFNCVFFLVVYKWILLFYSLCLWQLCLLLGVFMFNTVIDMVGVLLPLSFWFFFFLVVVVPTFTLFCCLLYHLI